MNRSNIQPARFTKLVFFLPLFILLFLPTANQQVFGADQQAMAQPTADNDNLACSASPFGDKLPFLTENEILVPTESGGFVWDFNGSSLSTVADVETSVNYDAKIMTNLSLDGSAQTVQAKVESNGSITVLVHGRESTGNPTVLNSWNSATDGGMTADFAAVRLVAADTTKFFGGKELMVLGETTNSFHQVILLVNGDQTNQNGVALFRDETINQDINTFLHNEEVKLAAGDLDGDGFDERIVAARHSGNDFIFEFSTDRFNGHRLFKVNTSVQNDLGLFSTDQIRFSLDVGNVQGDLRDEIVLTLFSNRNSRVIVFEAPALGEPYVADPENSAFSLMQPVIDLADMPPVTAGNPAATALYNLGSDPYAELLFVEADNLTVWDLNSTGGSKAQYFDLPNYSSAVSVTSVAGGKMQLGGLPGIAVAFNTLDQIGITYLEAEYDTAGELTLIKKADNVQSVSGAIGSAVTFGDWDHDSVYAELSSDDTDCSKVTDHPITTVAWWPAFWQKLQNDVPIEAAIGTVTTSGVGDEKSQTIVRSHDISGYVGAKAELDIPFASSISAEAKVTAGANFEQSQGFTRANETVTQLAQTQKVSTDLGAEKAGMIQGAKTTSNCFVYRVPADHPDVEGVLKLCQLLTSSSTSGTLFNHQEQSVPDRGRQWANVQRDWANLALFKSVSQSSTNDGHSAGHAIDMNMVSGTHTPAMVPYAATNSETNPWWQVDLGELQSISNVRLWIRPILNPSTNTLIYPADVHIFVSPDPFGSKTFAQLLDDPRVTYVVQEKAGKVVNISMMRQLLDDDPDPESAPVFKPIAGRYLRVQLAGSGQLALDEVQIFGDTHIDPDRYPLEVRDNSNPLIDGWHEVQLHNPTNGQDVWLPARGDINHTLDNVWKNQSWTSTPESEWEFGQEMMTESSRFTGAATSQRIGAEINAEVGPAVAGAAYEFGSGLSSENSTSTSWGTGFSIGGTLTGIPDSYSQAIKDNCDYRTSPYSYNLIEPTDSGYSHNVMVIDYTANPMSRGTLASCADTPTFDSDGDGLEDGVDAEPYTLNAPQFEFSQAQYTFSESAGSPQITVKLDELPSAPISVNVNVLPLSQSRHHAQVGADQDAIFTEQTLTFNSPGSQTVTLPLVDDDNFEFDERLYLRLAYSSGGGTVITDQVEIVIQDDDNPDVPLGSPGQALSFNGDESDRVTMSKKPTIGNTDHTVELWVKVPVVGTMGLEENERPGIMIGSLTSFSDISGLGGRSNWDIVADGTARVWWGDGGGSNSTADFFLTGTTDLRDGNWHHLAYVRDKTADTYSIYLDGVKEAEHDSAGIDMDWAAEFNGGAPFMIGGDYRTSRMAFFHGEIDEIRIWSTALNPASIRTLADINFSDSSFEFGQLVNYLPFNEGSGNQTRDVIDLDLGTLGAGSLFQPDWVNNSATSPAVQFVAGTQAVSESAGNAVVELKLARKTDSDIDVTVTSSSGTANSPADFTAVSKTVTIPAGSRSQSVSIPIVADDLEESNEQFTLTLTSSDAAVYGNKTAEITIVDDDGDPLTVSVVGGVVLNVANGADSTDRTVGYLLQLSKAVNQPVTVDVSVASGTTAVSGTEFSAPTTVTFAPDARIASLPVSLFEAAAGSQKVIKLNLTSSSAAVSDQVVTVNLLGESPSSGENRIFLPLIVR